MATSIHSDTVKQVISNAKQQKKKTVQVGNEQVEITVPFPSPEDWRDQWIYNIMIDRFNNPDSPPKQSWDGEHNLFQGGTFQGICQQLDYLKELGVGALWLSPVFKNGQNREETYHGYGIQDFLTVDPRFGTEEELINLVDQAHARGIYIIFDIVLNHCGDVFEYKDIGSCADWRDYPYDIYWRDENSHPREDWAKAPVRCHKDAAVFPDELRYNMYFRRQGKGGEHGGDFESLKELVTEFVEPNHPQHGYYFPVRDILIKMYQYSIAKFDVDGFRIDTLKYIRPDFARIFGNSMREFALRIGKANFFTFGEVWDSEQKIAQYIGRNAACPDDIIGVDAALDFPLFYHLSGCIKGFNGQSAQSLERVFEERKQYHKNLLSFHGEASRFFVTFLDNHDQHSRFFYADPQGKYDAQLSLGVCLLFTLQGIPCVYYGTEQGLHGSGHSDKFVREALWGKPDPFDMTNTFFKAIQDIARLRAEIPVLRYGRQYFREVSGNGMDFGISPYSPGVVAYCRILNDEEVLVVANTQVDKSWTGHVLVDFALNPPDNTNWKVHFSNMESPTEPSPITEKPAGAVKINGVPTGGRVRYVTASLSPMEVMVLWKNV